MNGTISQIMEASNKWGFKSQKKTYTGPTWARFRLCVQYDSGRAYYHSYDYYYNTMDGNKTKIKSENIGFMKLLELAHSIKKKGRKFRYMNIFANLTNDTNTTTGNYDYIVCTITNSGIIYKGKLYWFKDNDSMLDIKFINGK